MLEGVDLRMPAGEVTALIGPSGCGKSTFLRLLNRMHELVPGAPLAGEILLDGEDIYRPGIRAQEVRTRIGMVFQKPNPFPAMTIRDNVLAGLKLARIKCRDADALVEQSLRAGRACGARSATASTRPAARSRAASSSASASPDPLAVQPNVLLMDEPCSALDPTSTRRIEDTIAELRGEVTVVIVTHNMQQAQRVSDHCAFFLAAENEPGHVVEHGPTAKLFSEPRRSAHARLRRGSVRLMAPPRRRRVLVVLLLLAGAIGAMASTAVTAGARPERASASTPPARAARRAPINGQGSTYVGLAMQQWTAAGQNFGLNVNYLPTGSPDGLEPLRRRPGRLRRHRGGVRSSLAGSGDTDVRRGFQYVPDVAGAVAIMYNVQDRSGRKVDYLHLSRSHDRQDLHRAPSRNWNDPQIAADNKPAPQVARQADQRRLPRRPVGHHRPVLRLRREHRARRVRRRGPGATASAPACASSSSTARRNFAPEAAGAQRRRTRSPSTWPATAALVASATTSSATPRPTGRRRPGSTTRPASGSCPTR